MMAKSSIAIILFVPGVLVYFLLLPFTMAFAGWGPPVEVSYSASAVKLQRGSAIELDAYAEDHLKTVDILSLDSIRSTLIRQEETIIFALIERSQFRQNLIVYKKGGFGDLGYPPGSTPVDDQLSFLEYMLVGTETLHCG